MYLYLLLSFTLVAASLAIEPPTTPPFIHPRGTGGMVVACNNVVHSTLDYGMVEGIDGNPLNNMLAFNKALKALQPCDTLHLPKGVYKTVGGIIGENLRNNTIIIDGTLEYNFNDYSVWPPSPPEPTKKFADCISFMSCVDTVITSSEVGLGVLDGGGKPWWDKMILGQLPGPPGSSAGHDSRPKLLVVRDGVEMLVERLHLVNSPAWNFPFSAVRGEVRDINIEIDRDYQRELKSRKVRADSLKDRALMWLLDQLMGILPDWVLQPEDLNTDGIDPSGMDIYVHRVKVYNDDDSIAVKPSYKGSRIQGEAPFDCSQNILIENSELVGFGASIGSVGPKSGRPCVDGVTMRNITMPGTGKGIYVKSNGDDCNDPTHTSQLSNLLFEDFHIKNPWWYAVWIGPQEQNEPGEALGLACALTYPIGNAQCPTQGCSDFRNITLRNILIENPKMSPGAILGNSTNPMQGIVFDNVKVKQKSLVLGRWPWKEDKYPWHGTYQSVAAPGTCINGCDPMPEGFTSQ